MKKILSKIPLLGLMLTLSGCNQDQTGQPSTSEAAVQVGYTVLRPQSVPRHIDLTGRVVALATAEIRPQVDGIVRRMAFLEGRQVAAGDRLYELDDSRFRAALASSSAALKKATAATAGAQATFDRNQTLSKTNAVSAQTLDDARSTLLQAEAEEEAAKAAVQTAQINLDDTVILAPISGIIGTSAVSVGSLVTANQTDALATIRQVDPIHVDLVDSSANLLRIRDEVEAGRLGRKSGDPTAVKLTLENGKAYQVTGEISLADMVVSQTTGTFSMRARFSNSDSVLIPGMFVRASVDLGTMPKAFLVPQRALTRGGDGNAKVYILSADNKAEQKPVITSGTTGNDWIVVDGVKDGDKLIVDGFQKISSGKSVEPIEATIDDDGVVEQTLSTSTGRQEVAK
ncbi:efflux RND transporter periplasmic adaptor subunit [Agrobacterium rubi]|uniref:efflux RND transporter periplasmic adaptor subunit n=1 Tax=Agrobacterium rubi TaxID=28099 RepID=UPI001574002C|nr:efflux RND transporter periplasmic adaptor subunit [Agrobacterium rubi]NTF10527.1 efflux RND transporter periplasmic adaptor subunit [Agrobacterium rubi]NTF22921.1 efflux RND transporter periplasmic adaptor subunit [Agrobacterium rubi]NTF29852.1 efflux RND transporter periplasmic adaptor subunit [Agrobacterium rubi]